MRKFWALLLVIAIILMIFSFGSYKLTSFSDSFQDANVSSFNSLPYQDLQIGYRSAPYDQYGFSRYYDNNVLYNLNYSREIIISSEYIFIIRVERPDLYAPYIMDNLDSGNLLIDLPVDAINVSVLTKDSSGIGYDVASGDLDGTSNAIQSYLVEDYDITLMSLRGEFYSSNNQLLDRALRVAFSSFNCLDLKYMPVSDDINFSINSRGYNVVANTFFRDFFLADFTIGNGYKYIESISNDIELLGPAPVVPDTNFGDQPLQFLGDYFSWIVAEIVYLTRFAAIIFRGVF